jgi:hypothetical protein
VTLTHESDDNDTQRHTTTTTSRTMTAPPSLQMRVGGAVYFLLLYIDDGPTLATNASRWGHLFVLLYIDDGPTLATNASRWGHLFSITIHRRRPHPRYKRETVGLPTSLLDWGHRGNWPKRRVASFGPMHVVIIIYGKWAQHTHHSSCRSGPLNDYMYIILL